MRMFISIALLVACNASMARAGDGPQSLTDLARLNSGQLEALFLNAPRPTEIPSGKTRGLVFFEPGKLTSRLQGRIFQLLWQGKKLDSSAGIMKNRVGPFTVIPAAIYLDESFTDGDTALVLDYHGMQSKTTQFADGARDEVREISPGLWLGRMWMLGKDGNYTPSSWFALKWLEN
jgi:hypothetical protein